MASPVVTPQADDSQWETVQAPAPAQSAPSDGDWETVQPNTVSQVPSIGTELKETGKGLVKGLASDVLGSNPFTGSAMAFDTHVPAIENFKHRLDATNNDQKFGKAINIAGQVVAGGGAGGAEEAVGNLAKSGVAKFTTEGITEGVHNSIRNVMAKVADEAGVKVAPADSVRDMAKSVPNAVLAKARSMYQQIDSVLGHGADGPGSFQDLMEKISKHEDAYDHAIGEPEKQEKILTSLDKLKAEHTALTQQLKDAGLGDLPEKATALFKKGKRLEEIAAAVNQHTTGLPAKVIAQTGSTASPEAVNPGGLLKKLTSMYYDTARGPEGKLSQGLGEHNAHNLLNDLASGERLQTRLDSYKKMASKVLKYGGLAGVGGGAGAEAISHFTR